MSVFPDDIFAADPLAAVIEEKTIQLKEGERRNVSILFADLKGFTEMSEKLDPEFVQTNIDKIMSVFTQVIKNHGGYVDKYSGDEVMALFGAKVASEVTLSIYNLKGREVASLIDGIMDAGYHSVVWNADSHSSGVYFVKMLAGEFVNTQKLMLVK